MNKCILLFLFLCCQFLMAQEQVHTKWAIYKAQNQDSFSLKTKEENKKTTGLLKLKEGYPSSWLKNQGVELLRALDRQHYIVNVTDAQFKMLAKGHSIVQSNNKWKLSNMLLLGTHKKKRHYTIKSNAPEKTIGHLNSIGKIKLTGTSKNLIFVYGKLELLQKELLPRKEVLYIGKESFSPNSESTVRDLNPAINNINRIYRDFPDLRGNEITISLKDNRFIENDIDLRNKLVSSPLISNTVTNHATDMATIISGLGNSSIKGRGVAPEATIQLSDLSQLFPDGNEFLSNNDILIQNHSYGTEIENFYGSLAEAYDTHIYENPTELHIFSSGNAGLELPQNGLYQGIGTYANLTGNFKMSKNTLSIGAIDEENNKSSFSSVGPAYDGRIKPELVAYSIIGTSNATALVSGTSGLLQEYYTTTFGQDPSASLLKASLINSADDIGAIGPDFISGYGKINGYNALKTLVDNHIITASVDQGTSRTFTIDIPQNTKNFKATLVWTDPPAAINSNLALVNDLDLSAANATTTYLPWVLDSSPNLVSLESAATRGADHTNTIEQVFIENPVSGSIVLEVTGFDLPSGDQEFSIAYGWEEANDFIWNYPLANDNFPYDGETASYFRWNSSFDTEEGELSISYDDGVTWEIIASQTILSEGFYLWSAPENITTTARLKMTIDQNEFISDSFVVSNISTLGVGLDCDDTVQLSWNKQNNVQEYNIYNLEADMMQLTAVTTDTTYVFNKTEIASNYFAVQSVLPNGRLGLLSATIDFTDFDAGCYESFIIAEVSEDGEAGQLEIQLSSLFNVAVIEVERKEGASFTTIGEFRNPDSINLLYLDQQPSQGLNTYRLKVVLNDGTSFLSEESELFFLTTVAFATFPNPIKEGINVFTKEFTDAEIWMEIYGLDGKFIIAKKIDSDRAFITLDELVQGLYAMTIYSDQGDRMEKLIYKL